MGPELALARRKRGISTDDMAARLFVSRDTLWRLERGDPKVAVGTLATVAFVLQLHDRLQFYNYLADRIRVVVDIYDRDKYFGSKNYYGRRSPLTAANKLGPPIT